MIKTTAYLPSKKSSSEIREAVKRSEKYPFRSVYLEKLLQVLYGQREQRKPFQIASVPPIGSSVTTPDGFGWIADIDTDYCPHWIYVVFPGGDWKKYSWLELE